MFAGTQSPHLLGLIEAVDLIDEHDGSPLAESEFVLCLLDHLSHVAGGRTGGGELHKAHSSLLLALAGYDVSKSGLEMERKPAGHKVN